MVNKSYAVRSLPSEQTFQLAVNDDVLISIDSRLDCQAIRFNNQTQRTMTIRCDGGLTQFIQPGVSARNFPNGVYNIVIQNDDSNASTGQLFVQFYEEQLPDTPDVVPYTNAILASNNVSISAVDSTLSFTIVGVPNGSRFRLLAFRCMLSYSCVAGAAAGTSSFQARIEGLVFATIGPVFLMQRHTTTAVAADTGESETGWVKLDEPGVVFPDGLDVDIFVGHNTVQGTAPGNMRAIATGEVWGITEPSQ